MLDPGAFAAAAITLHAAHLTADYWLQTEHQAITKGTPGWRGRVACASHVAVLTATQAVFLLVADRLFGLDLSAGWVAAGLTLNAVTHWWADRRWTLRWLADLLDRTRLVRGKGVFARLGDPVAAVCGTGAHALDQSWHVVWLLPVAALAVA